MGLALPLPTDLAEVARVEHTRERRRLTNGEGLPDFQAQLLKRFGPTRASAIGEVDASLNPLDDNCSAAAALYDLHPRIGNPDEASQKALLRVADNALLYAMMPRFQKDVLVQREELIRVDVRLDAGNPVAAYRPVYADMVGMRANPEQPSQPIELFEYVERNAPGREGTIWTREVWSIDGVPRHQVLSEDGREDLSRFYGLPEGGARGEQYPAIRTSDRRPFLPYVLFHAAMTGHLLDWAYKRELVLGTKNVVVAWTYFGHVLHRGAHDTRYIAGGEIVGTVGKDGRREAVGDPAAVVEILPDPMGKGQLLVGQWGAAVDPLNFSRASTRSASTTTWASTSAGTTTRRTRAPGSRSWQTRRPDARRSGSSRRCSPPRTPRSWPSPRPSRTAHSAVATSRRTAGRSSTSASPRRPRSATGSAGRPSNCWTSG